MARRLLLVLVAGGAACSFDWTSLDPRLGDAGGGGEATTSATDSGGSTASVGGGGSAASGGGSGGSGGSGGAGSGGAATGGGGSSTIEVSYLATVADCLLDGVPDPDACAAAQAVGHLTVDLDATNMMQPAYGFFRFEPDGQLAGHTVLAAELRFTVGDAVGSDSDQTGELYRVQDFVRSDLFSAPPPSLVGGVIGMNQGAVVAGTVVTWPISVGSVLPNVPLCFSLQPVTINGVDYYNLLGASPPRLVVTLAP